MQYLKTPNSYKKVHDWQTINILNKDGISITDFFPLAPGFNLAQHGTRFKAPSFTELPIKPQPKIEGAMSSQTML